MHKKPQIIFLSGMVLGLVLLSGCANKGNEQTQNPTDNLQQGGAKSDAQLNECYKLSDINRTKDFCITNIAVGKKDASICDNNALSSEYKYECRTQVFAKLDKCLDLIPLALQATCFFYMAEQQKNVGICDRIKEIGKNGWEDFRDSCYLNYYGISNATGFTKEKNNDPAICEKLLARDGRNTCYYNMADARDDDSFCDKYVAESKGEKGSKDNCYFKIAVKKNNEELCGKINDYVYTQQRCYYDIAKNKPDASLCDKIPTEQTVRERLIEECLKDGGAEVTCSQISGNSIKRQCYYDLAEKQKDKSICEKLTDKYEKEYCQNVAEKGVAQ